MTREFLTPIELPADPVAPMEGATKQYVDARIVPDEVWIGDTDPYLTDPTGSWELWIEPVAALPAPTLTALTPNTAPVGTATTVSCAGSDFQVGAEVLIDGAAAVTTFVSASEVTFSVTPAAAGSGQVTVRNPDAQTSGAVPLTYEVVLLIPTISHCPTEPAPRVQGDGVASRNPDYYSFKVTATGGMPGNSYTLEAPPATVVAPTQVADANGSAVWLINAAGVQPGPFTATLHDGASTADPVIATDPVPLTTAVGLTPVGVDTPLLVGTSYTIEVGICQAGRTYRFALSGPGSVGIPTPGDQTAAAQGSLYWTIVPVTPGRIVLDYILMPLPADAGCFPMDPAGAGVGLLAYTHDRDVV